jgi:hypothetical protein
MNLLANPQKIIIRKTMNPSVAKAEEIEKGFDLIKIKPTRLENIMIDLCYPATNKPPKQFRVYFFDANLEGYSSSIYHTDFLNQLKYEDEQYKGIRILKTGHADSIDRNSTIVKSIGFDSEKDDINFECYITIQMKFTYQINSKNIKQELWFDDGQRHHDKGDIITYAGMEDIIINVMEIDEEKWIAKCGAWAKK